MVHIIPKSSSKKVFGKKKNFVDKPNFIVQNKKNKLIIPLPLIFRAGSWPTYHNVAPPLIRPKHYKIVNVSNKIN